MIFIHKGGQTYFPPKDQYNAIAKLFELFKMYEMFDLY